MRRTKWMALLAALALAAGLMAGCGGKENEEPKQPAAPVPVQDENDSDPSEDTVSPDVQPQAPEGTPPADPEPEEEAQPENTEPADMQSEEEPPETPAPEEPVNEPEPQPEPEPEPAETIPEDGTYTANVTLEGGTGRATVESPATLRCEGGKFYATIVWSSPNFDYMKLDGEKYELISEPGSNSSFEIPVTAFDQKLDIIADTVAMSEPHEVEYTLTFDSASLTKQ